MKEFNFAIVQGEVCDIESIIQFQADMAMESEEIVLDLEKLRQGVTAAMNDKSKGTYWVARLEDRTIASLMITREWSDWNNQWYWWIQSVYVMPEYRKYGVYKEMYAALKNEAKKCGISQIRLYVDKTNHLAQKVYHRLGMHESHYLMFEENINK